MANTIFSAEDTAHRRKLADMRRKTLEAVARLRRNQAALKRQAGRQYDAVQARLAELGEPAEGDSQAEGEYLKLLEKRKTLLHVIDSLPE